MTHHDYIMAVRNLLIFLAFGTKGGLYLRRRRRNR